MMDAWPIPIELKPSESLSSWLTRAALGHGCDPLVLTGWLWSKWRAWTYDLDRGIPENKLEVLTKRSMLSRQDLEDASLAAMASCFTNRKLPKYGVWPWIQALGVRNRLYRGGLQFCPLCFQGDKSPFFRKLWRCSWVTSCWEHQIQLIDRCPDCHSPIEPHRLEAIHSDVLSVCASCGFDFRSSPQVIALKNSANFQRLAQSVVSDGGTTINDSFVNPKDWFEACRYLLGIIRRTVLTPESNLAHALHTSCGGALNIKPDTLPLQLEFLEREARAKLTSYLYKLINNLEQFSSELIKTGAQATSLVENNTVIPTSLKFLVERLEHQGSRSRKYKKSGRSRVRSKASVLKSWARLKRKYRL